MPPPRLERPQTADEIQKAFESMLAFGAMESRARRAKQALDALEADALRVYGKHGLPTDYGLYSLGRDRVWRKFLPPPMKPGVIREPPPVSIPNFSDAEGRVVRLEDLAETQFGPDHEASFAGAILNALTHLRHLIARAESEGNVLALEVFHVALQAQNWWAMMEVEFVHGPKIAIETDMEVSRSNGGKATSLALNRASEWAAWQAEADRIWSGSPDLPKSRVAKFVKDRLGLWESESIIRHRIKKLASR